MNYQHHYDLLIAKAQQREHPEGYCERHHIVPKSLGGTDDSTNLVVLTAKEHFFAHLLLTKIHTGESKAKMIYALWCMSIVKAEDCNLYRPCSRRYAYLRSEYSKLAKDNKVGARWWNNGVKEKIQKDCPDASWQPGRLKGKASIQWSPRGQSWWHNNGKAVYSSECPGEGWKPGRGRGITNGMAWYNNGTDTKRFSEAPSSEWKPGRLKLRPYVRKNK